LRIESGRATDKGLVRRHNEDNLLTLELNASGCPQEPFFGLYAVADGVGGQDDGEVASDMALRALSASILKSVLLPEFENKPSIVHSEPLKTVLHDCVQAANHLVFSKSQGTDTGMGTTLAAMLVFGDKALIANVGDSRIYLLRNNILKQVTTDHSLVAEMVAAGELTQEETYTHPRRNVITRCLGMSDEINIDLFTGELIPGDLFLICSDGLWEMVRDVEIQAIISESPNPQSACERLVEAANKNGGLDNISAVIVRATGDEKDTTE
jgi:protein phosphatase